ncbi:hypothetical protein SAMN05444166_5402 [Singulisphaera sp. GP187]|uniref:hypothetical protein n=1 Tax=Singulisphaera sp. GP187 TaxID=1882752 RepID=UPI00092C273C|nr:hypothetical protein [Singulisphaera sp. GP187]SIO57431.1 hypothetical protein SAMN05444166_5402 [Singulisphaera sp. GP187]
MTTEPQVRVARPSSRARVRYNAGMKLVRRAHMYVGLFLVPFVLLYGLTAFLFNHPDWFSDRSVRLITAEDAAGTALGSFPTADELSAQVIQAINQGGTHRVSLSKAQAPAYSRDLALTAKGSGAEQVIFLELAGRTGTVRSAPAATKPVSKPAWARESVRLDSPPAEAARTAVAAILTKWGGGEPPEEVKVRTPPELIFAVESEGRTWRASYQLQTEALTVRPWGPDLSTRRFLTAMHLACRYPSQINVPWCWAAIVDTMAVAMVFWGFSGLFMWWQMKSLRRLGAIVLAASLIGSILVAIGMHGILGR